MTRSIQLIGLTGQAGSGKSTVSQYLVDHHGFCRISLADPIKAGLAAMFPISKETMTNRDLKEKPLDILCGKSPRFAMQTLGTEWGRETIGKDIWIRVAETKIDFLNQIHTTRGIVIDDIRFDSEAEWLEQKGGNLWHILRPINPNKIDTQHESESGIEPQPQDRIIINDRDIEHLYNRIAELIGEIKEAS